MIYFENQTPLELKNLEFERILEYLHITREVEVYILEDEDMAEGRNKC